MNSDAGSANALHMALRCKPGSINVLAPVCSTWAWVNRRAAGRKERGPHGNTKRPQVVAANKNIAHCVLLMLIISARGGLRVLEQPSSSILNRHPDFQDMLRIIKVFRAFVYMGVFGAPSLKPTALRCNGKCIKDLEVQGNIYLYIIP
eukprot:2817287-Pyramimonas_sp.AAC.1